MSSKFTPKGMRDFSPKQMYLRLQVINKIREIFISYGFRPIETPSLEYLSTLKAKAGDEAESQIFIIDGNEYGLRFDLTVPLARYLASDDSPRPFKRFAIDRVWRKEEPQRGRFREFYQADVDIVGSFSMRSEIELLNLGISVCTAFGFNSPRVLLNNRKILDAIAITLNLTPNEKSKVFRILDKLDKVGEAEVRKMLDAVIASRTSDLMEIVTFSGTNSEKILFASKLSPDGAKELEEIANSCPFVEIDFSLVRGLGYYTGPIFEIKLSKGMGTVLSGGRYDGLLGVYGKNDPAVGISVGIERLITLLEENNSLSSPISQTQIFIASTSDSSYSGAFRIANELRTNGFNVETDICSRSLKKQLEYSNSLGIPIVIIAGDKDLQLDCVTLKDMRNSSEMKIKTGEILQCIKSLNLS